MKKNYKKIAVMLAIMALLSVFFSVNCFAAGAPAITVTPINDVVEDMYVPVMADLKLNPDYDENTIIKTVIKYIGAIIALVGVVAGIFFFAQGSFSEQPEKKKLGVEVLITCLCAAGLIVALTNMILA